MLLLLRCYFFNHLKTKSPCSPGKLSSTTKICASRSWCKVKRLAECMTCYNNVIKFHRFFVQILLDTLHDTTWSRSTQLPRQVYSSMSIVISGRLECFSSAKSSMPADSRDHNSSLLVAPVGTCKLWAARAPCPPAQPSSDTIFLIVDDECVEAGRAIGAAERYTDVLAARGARRKRKRTSRNETYNATYGEIMRECA